jgi:hypothetical protein
VPASRDPVSELMDRGAAKLLDRAYKRPNVWVGTRLARPTTKHEAWARAMGIALDGPDNAPGGQAKDRWTRAFIRSVYWHHKWFYREGEGLRLGDRRAAANQSKALQYEVGVLAGPGRAVRIRIRQGGAAASKAAEKMPESRKIFVNGEPGPRWADPGRRDW